MLGNYVWFAVLPLLRRKSPGFSVAIWTLSGLLSGPKTTRRWSRETASSRCCELSNVMKPYAVGASIVLGWGATSWLAWISIDVVDLGACEIKFVDFENSSGSFLKNRWSISFGSPVSLPQPSPQTRSGSAFLNAFTKLLILYIVYHPLLTYRHGLQATRFRIQPPKVGRVEDRCLHDAFAEIFSSLVRNC